MKLRQEAEELESKLDRKKPKVTDMNNVEPAVAYTNVNDSIWSFTYRFSSDPPPKDEEEPREVSNYSGKIKLKLRADGYTDLLSQESTGKDKVYFRKLWGWDQELSNEDGMMYILFSANVQLPENDLSLPNEVIRFYWQARMDTDKQEGTITLDDGTVTMKKDVEPPGGFWGVFSGAGILAQFRFVGNFLAKPSS